MKRSIRFLLGRNWVNWAFFLVCLSCFSLPIYRAFAESADAQPAAQILQQVPFAAAFEIADQVTANVLSANSLPDYFQITDANGNPEEISASQALWLLAVAANKIGKDTSASLPLIQIEIGAPVGITATSSAAPVFFSTQAILAQGRPIQDFTLALGGLPTAVWISEQRLSATDIFVAFASIFQYFADSQQLPDTVRMVSCSPPKTWQLPPEKAATEKQAFAPMPSSSANPVPASPPPTLRLSLAEGSKIQGEVEVTAALEPSMPDITMLFFLDGHLQSATNCTPYNIYLNASSLTVGRHNLKAQAEVGQGKILASHEVSFRIDK